MKRLYSKYNENERLLRCARNDEMDSRFRGNDNRGGKGFSLIELGVTLVILAVGLWSFSGLFKDYRNQSDYIAMNSEPNLYIENAEEDTREYRIISQSNKWMRELKAPAGIIEGTADQNPWEPSVDGNDVGEYSVTMTSTPVKDFDLERAVVGIHIEKVE